MSEWETIAPAANAGQPGQAGGTPTPPPAQAAQEWEPVFQQAPASALNSIDRKTGGPKALRLAVAQAETPEDQLAVARQAYPDARWIEFGEQPGEQFSRQTGTTYQRGGTPERHIVYTGESGQPTTLNPAGLDMGDVLELGPEAVRMGAYVAGMIPGAGLGAAASGGNPAGAAAGAAIGGTAASQAVKYATTPLVEWATGYTIPDTRPMGEKVKAGLVDVGFEFGGGFGGEVTVMAARGGSNALRGWRAARKYRPEGMGRPEVIQDLKAMAVEQGKAPAEGTAGALPFATRSVGFRGPYQAAAKYPGKASDTINDALDNTINVLRDEADRLHVEAGGVKSLTTGGDLAQKGIERAGQDAISRQRVIEKSVERMVGAETPADAAPIYDLIQEQVGKASRKVPVRDGAGSVVGERLELRASSGDVLPKEYRDLMADLKAEDGALPFGYLRAKRDAIGDKIGVSRVVQDDSTSVEQLRRLYGAITETLGNAAQARGGQAAAKWAEGQVHWAAWKAQQESVRIIANQPVVEQAFKSMFGGLKDGGSLFKSVLATVPEQYQDGLRSLALWKMGATSSTRSAAGEPLEVYDLATFARNWRAMKTSGGLDVVLPPRAPAGSKWARLKAGYERLGRGALAGEEGLVGPKAMLNPSGSAQAIQANEDLASSGVAAALAGGPKAALSLGGRNALTRYLRNQSAARQAALMTDPDFVDWGAGLLETAPLPPRGGLRRGFTFSAGSVTRLGGVAVGKRRDVQEAVLQMLEEIKADTPPDEPQ